MEIDMFERAIAPKLEEAVSTFPVTVLTGPRQSGKTSLLKYLYPDFKYINLESPDSLAILQEDPKGFLISTPGKFIIDEAQKYPEFFSFLQEHIDTHADAKHIILSGSQNFLLSNRISQTLAGRAAILELLPLSYSEYLTHEKFEPLDAWEFVFNGGYPRPYQEGLDLKLWYNSYIRTYLERDVRSLINLKDLSKFQLFLKLCAGRHGQILNLSEIAESCGISQPTAENWVSILEASYLIFRLQPYYRNFTKRIVKRPKLYFYDSAIVCMLLGVESPDHLKIHASRGHIFEGFIISEFIKSYFARGETAPIYFWRDSKQNEVDLIIEQGENIYAIEIKSTSTYKPRLLDGILKLQKISEHAITHGILVYSGDENFVLKGVQVTPWNEIQW